MLPLYLAVLERAKLSNEHTLLDAGCGAGGFLRLAGATGVGLEMHGIDAAPGLIEIAGTRAPEAALRVGDLEELPYHDASFDVVTALNSYQFAADPAAALREAARVTRVGGRVFIASWGRAEDCEAAFYVRALASLLPPPRPGTPGPFALSEPRQLEHLALDVGLTPIAVAEVDAPWRFQNLDTALRALLSPGFAVRAIRATSEPLVRSVVMDAIAPFRTSRGEYRLENRMRFIVARRVVALYTTYLQRS
jgi:SAM-dependent methyltransferase